MAEWKSHTTRPARRRGWWRLTRNAIEAGYDCSPIVRDMHTGWHMALVIKHYAKRRRMHDEQRQAA